MNNIVNEKNYKGYKNLYKIRTEPANNSDYYGNKENTLTSIACAVIGVLTLATYGLVAVSVVNILGEGIGTIICGSLIGFAVSVGVTIGGIYGVTKLEEKSLIKKIKADYPEINTNIDNKELAKELVKYEELSKVPKNIEKQKEEHISYIENNMRSLSTEEKIEYLKKKSEFWSLVAIEEKYSEMGIAEEQKPVQKRKVESCQKNQK